MFLRLENCPSCGALDLSNHMIVQDYFFTKESFHLSKCNQCTLVFTNPIPSSDRLSKYYQSDKYLSHHASSTAIGKVYEILRYFNIRYKHAIIRKEYPKAQTLLDYGCGTGSFLVQLNRYYTSTGIELDDDARNQTLAKGIKAFKTIELLPPTERYDLVTLWHVLEHVSTLHDTLDTLRIHLIKDGIIVIAVPNILSWDAIHFQDKWAAYDVPRHLYHFSTDSLKRLLRSHRLRIKNKYGLPLDSFFISLQSLRYEGKGFSPIRAIRYGLQSNRHGKLTGEYSSNLYICEKY